MPASSANPGRRILSVYLTASAALMGSVTAAQVPAHVIQSVTPVADLATALASQGLPAAHLDNAITSDGAITLLAFPNESTQNNAVLVRTGASGHVLWRTPLGSGEASDLVVTHSGESAVILNDVSKPGAQLARYDANGKPTSIQDVGDVAKLCLVGDDLIGLDARGYVVRLSNGKKIATVRASSNSLIVGVGAKTAVVIDRIQGTLDSVDIDTGANHQVTLDDPNLNATREQYRRELAGTEVRGVSILAASSFNSEILLLLSGFPATGLPLIAVDLAGHTQSTTWIEMPVDGVGKRTFPVFLSVDRQAGATLLDRSGNVSTLTVK